MYSEKKRFGQDPTKVVRSKPATFNTPLRWKEPQRIFVCSWSDFFHPDADPWRDEAWLIIQQASQHTYMILTKRPEHMPTLSPWLPPNAWLGVSISGPRDLWRIGALRKIPATMKFISIEPMLAPLGLNLSGSGINWVICGGESGPKRRVFDEAWARRLRDQCVEAGVPFFYKQGRDAQNRVIEMPELDGKVWAQFPDGRTEENVDG